MSVQLFHGDCLNIMPTIPDKSIDMILCDLPYGTTACKWDVIIPFEPLWKEYKRIIKDRGCIALFGSEPFSSYLRISNMKDFKYDWYWKKDRASNHLNAKKQPMRNIESVSIFNSKSYSPIMEYWGEPSHSVGKVMGSVQKGTTTGDFKTTGGNLTENIKYPRQLLSYAIPHPRIHPTEKPVLLLEYLIKTYTLENETILDNCMGSGSTGVACINTNRNFIGIEKEENYFQIAQKRIEDSKKLITQKLF